MSGLSLSLLAETQRLLAPGLIPGEIMLMQKPPAPTKKSAKPEAPAARILSPRRKTTQATSLHELAVEQLEHFHIDPKSPTGQPLLALAEKLYAAHGDVMDLWEATTRELGRLPRQDRLALFNAKKFLSFQLAKLLHKLTNP